MIISLHLPDTIGILMEIEDLTPEEIKKKIGDLNKEVEQKRKLYNSFMEKFSTSPSSPPSEINFEKIERELDELQSQIIQLKSAL